MTVLQAKRALRVTAGACRQAAHAAHGATAGATLRERVLATVEMAADATVSGYWPMRDEIDPRPLLYALHDRGLRCLLPIVRGRGKPLQFRVWHPGMALVEGSYGERIPGADATEAVPTVLLVPLLAFDRTGYRLGYGRGYYDRTLAGLRAANGATAIGVAYAAQEVARVPRDATDEPLDWVITEREAIRIAKPEEL